MTAEEINKAELEIRKILDGIDKDDIEYNEGWWETSSGVEFGKKKLDEIIALFKRVMSEKV